MPETIRSYIDKNLTNLNWNILPQIFEENGVELTEEIEAYLRNTPENTNWNVFGSLGNENEEILFNSMTPVRSMGKPTCQDEYDGREINIGDQFKVIVGEYTYQFIMENQGEPSISSKIEAGEPILSFTNLVPGPVYVWMLTSNDLQIGDEVQVKIIRTKKV